MPPTFESVHLLDTHSFGTFQSSDPAINAWAKKRAHKEHQSGSAVIYVWVTEDAPSDVAAFFTLSNVSIPRPEGWPGERKEISATLLGMMGRSQAKTEPGQGVQLLRDALTRAKRISRDSGSRYVVVDAKNEALVGWYEAHGFRRLPDGGMRMVIAMADIPDR